MRNEKEKALSIRPFWNFHFLDEDVWGLDFEPRTGVSVSEDKDHVYVEANVPGLKPEEIDLSFEKGMLWVHGEKREEKEDREKKYYRKASTSFSYRVQVPGQIDEKKEPEAMYKDGVLKVSFVKTTQTQIKKIPIKSK